MSDGFLQRDPSTGKLLRNPQTGKLVRTPSTTTPCCCAGGPPPPPPPPDCPGTACDLCDTAPITYTVTFAGVATSTDCVSCTTAGSAVITGGSRIDAFGTFSGTFTLTQDAQNPCLWIYTDDTSVFGETHATSDCSLQPFTTDVFVVFLQRLDADTFSLEARVERGGSALHLFRQTFAGASCMTSFSGGNGISAPTCDTIDPANTGGDADVAAGGTATVTPCS